VEAKALCLLHAFQVWNGQPRVLLYDNLKSAVLEAAVPKSKVPIQGTGAVFTSMLAYSHSPGTTLRRCCCIAANLGVLAPKSTLSSPISRKQNDLYLSVRSCSKTTGMPV
jgi:hypothetical protein